MTQANPIDQATGNNLIFEDHITVQAPIHEVYNRWSDFPKFPAFMENIEAVRPLGDNRYHWVARIFGIKQEWDAEVTENEPQRRISWRSITGSYNTGTVSFRDLSADKTEIHLRLEYAPPGGKTGQVLDQLTRTTKRAVHQDLENFEKLLTDQVTGGQMGQYLGQGVQQQTNSGLTAVLVPLAVPLATSIAGGIASYIIGKRLRQTAAYSASTSSVALPNAIAGWALTGACAASILGSATLRSRGRATDALFVGQWAPTFLQMGNLARMLGHRAMRTNLTTSVTTWTAVAASLGAIATSATLHARGRRGDGLFVGQWAPTFLGAALFARLFNSSLTR
jgi:uncharacterized membrane protein